MPVRVLYFAALKERCGLDEEALDLPEPPTVAALKRSLEQRHPFLQNRWSAVRVAVNLQFGADDVALRDGDEVALIPPVAGGSEAPRARLLDAPLSLDVAVASVMDGTMGGLCVFAGYVRNHAHGKTVTSIDYSAYGPMALKVMQEILDKAEKAHGARIACHHRVGHLVVGEMAVVIAAAAPHRAPAFAACRDVIEWLKQDVPIWKHEHGEDGAVWVGMGP